MTPGPRRTLLFIGLLMLPLLPAQAQRNAGRNGATFLKVGVGAREVALGSAVSAIRNDANQIFWNPAGTALRPDQTLSATLSYGSWIGDIDYSAAAVGRENRSASRPSGCPGSRPTGRTATRTPS